MLLLCCYRYHVMCCSLWSLCWRDTAPSSRISLTLSQHVPSVPATVTSMPRSPSLRHPCRWNNLLSIIFFLSVWPKYYSSFQVFQTTWFTVFFGVFAFSHSVPRLRPPSMEFLRISQRVVTWPLRLVVRAICHASRLWSRPSVTRRVSHCCCSRRT